MWYQTLLIPIMVTTIFCHTPQNDSHIIVSYSGHSEAEYGVIPNPNTGTGVPEVTKNGDEEQVIFLPNDVPNKDAVIRSEEVNVGNILSKKTVGDVLNGSNVRIETESPQQDILFIQGKNNENQHVENKKTLEPKKANKPRTTKIKTLDCSNLDCNNTMNEVCGGKTEHRQWRYRLFLNECFFRKVNCNFKYEENRFQLVPVEKCKAISAHYSVRPSAHKHFKFSNPQQLSTSTSVPSERKRQAFVSRRSLNMDPNGRFCSHPCPVSCPEHYDPECAVSNSGIKRVFVNHCKLDYNSCVYGTAWYRRPLEECVGGKKADMTKNSGFISWMQRVGIVDNKGRLTLNAK